jgi:NIPSNAP
MNGCGVVELRRYTLHPGMRDTLIELFEREFVETQEAVGIDVRGTFTDVDAPDSFVWLRGFADMRTRGAALQAFYGGPVWAEHGNAANATMIDSDDVLLLRPLDQTSRLALDRAGRRPPGARRARARVMTVISRVRRRCSSVPRRARWRDQPSASVARERRGAGRERGARRRCAS